MKYWFLIAVSCAAVQGWADARDELSVRLSELTHLAADFTQRIEGVRGELIEESSGRVRLLAPNFRWEVTEPYAQVLVTAGDELHLYDPDFEQVTIRPLAEVLKDTPLALFTRETVMLGEDYAVGRLDGGSFDAAGRDRDRFSVRPRSEDALFEEIILTFGAPGLVGITIHDHLGQSTVIRFHRFQDASVIQSADFELTIPPGTDVF